MEWRNFLFFEEVYAKIKREFENFDSLDRSLKNLFRKSPLVRRSFDFAISQMFFLFTITKRI
jgi:hypothetical protein